MVLAAGDRRSDLHRTPRRRLTADVIYANQLGLPLVHAGKIRELYALDDNRLLMVATDKISAFDYVLDSLIPDKGSILNKLSQWWFGELAGLVENHVLSTDVPAPVTGRAVICERRDDSGRVRGAWLPDRIWVDRVRAIRDGVRHFVARRPG